MDKKTGKLKAVIGVVLVVLAVIISAVVITLPLLCTINGVGMSESFDRFHDNDIFFGVASGVVIGIFFGLVFELVFGLVIGVFFGFGYGLVVGFVSGIGYPGPACEVASGLVFGLVFGLGIRLAGFGVVSGVVSGVNFGVVFGVVFGLGIGVFFGLGIGVSSGIGIGIGTGIGYFVGFLFYEKIVAIIGKLRNEIKQTLGAIKDVINGLIHSRRLKEHPAGRAIVSFIILYVFTILLSSFWYYSIYLQDCSKYSNIYFNISGNIGISYLKNSIEGNEIRLLDWWHFLYFSVVTIVTVGYGDISPVGIIPQVLVVAEILLGFSLVVLYLAAIFQMTAWVEPKDESLQKQLKGLSNQELEVIKNEMEKLIKKVIDNIDKLRR